MSDAQKLAEQIVASMIASVAFSQWLGIEIVEVAPRRSTCRMTVRDEMVNGLGVTHGGIAFSLADSAFAYVCNGSNHASVAAQASIVFLGKAEEGETLVAEGWQVAREGRAGVTRVSVKTAEGRDVAEFTGYSRTLGGTVVEV